MNYVTRLLLVALCVLSWANSSLFAQITYEVNFASIRFVNLQLNDECARTVIYRNLLSGDADVDGDGIVPPEEAFIITIDDDSPDNNEELNGCGSFRYTVRPNPDSMVVGFTFGDGTINAQDGVPPTQFNVATAGAGPFFTPDLQDLTINTLPSSVSRSFMTDGGSGMPIMGTLNGSLMVRLLAGGAIPRFKDGCSDVDVTVEDVIQPAGPCDDIVITRTFTATDASATCSPDGGSSGSTTVSYDIILLRPDASNVQEPAPLVNYECDDPAIINNPFPDPRPEEYPFLDLPDGRLFLNDVYGNIGVSFTNSAAVELCENTVKYVRTYTVIDWCDTDNVQTFSQLVKVGDTNAPTINTPTQDLDFNGIADVGPLVFTTNAQDCGAFINTNTSGLSITDGCSSVMTVEAFVLVDGNPDNALGPINVNSPNPSERLTPFVPVGPHIIRYVATDECGNVGFEEVDIVVEDRSGPVVIVEDALNVALSTSGFATVTALDLDEGSYDDCSDITLDIAFANPNSLIAIGDFGPSITLSCIDVGAVPVIVRATDAEGNQNSRMSIINVIDNSAPICIAPGNVSLTCGEADNILPEDVNVALATDLSGTTALFNDLFGAPTSLDNCGNEQSTQLITSEINDCGTGQISRTFTVTDARGFASAPGCNQIISIRGVRDYSIRFPADAASTCGDNPDYDEVSFDAPGCDMIVTYVEQDTFFSTSDACFKLRNTIEVINWCEYDGFETVYTIRRDADSDLNFDEPTFVHVIPNNTASGDDDVAVIDSDADRENGNLGFVDIDDLTSNFDSDNDGDTGYGTSRSRGAFRYVQYVKIVDNNAPTITNISSDATPSVDCNGGGIDISYSILDDCAGANLTTSVELDENFNRTQGFSGSRLVRADEISTDANGNVVVSIATLPSGEHAIRVRASDGCGNTDGRVIPFTIEENTEVTPICATNLTFVLNPDGAGGGIMNVEADDYIISVNNNCLGVETEFSIYREAGEADQPGFTPQTGRTEFEVTCMEDGQNIAVRVYTFTPSGINSFCSANALVLASANVDCSGAANASISGFVTSPANDLLRNVPVYISDMQTMNDMMPTDANGSFLFTPLEEGAEYMVRPDIDEVVNMRRVRTSDITRISGHVLGNRPITNPYHLIAADVNNDGNLGIMDMIAINRVILGFEESFPAGPNWRFIRRDFNLDGLEEGFDADMFPTSYTVEELQGHNREADFIAIEMGDVYVTEGGRGTNSLTATDALLAAGERTELTITANELLALQGTFEALPGLTIEGWSSDLLAAANVNDTQISEGLLSFAYWTHDALDNDAAITLQLRADTDLRISDYLRISDRITFREALAAAGTPTTLDLTFSEQPVGASIVLHQNFPNPASAQTTIAFDLPTASAVTLEVHDLQGRRLTQRQLAGNAGRNTILLTNDDLQYTTGILSYTITVGTERLTKRMTVVATR